MITIEPVPISTLVACEYPAIGLGLASLIDTRQPTLVSHGVVTSLEDAASALSHTPPHVILVDIDGEFGAAAIERMAALSGARLIALTCSDDDAVRDPIIMAGVVGIVSKRASPDVLLHAIESVHGGEVWIDRRAIGRIFHDLSRKSRGDGHPLLHGLTAKERIVVEQIQVCPSAPNRMLADRLHISENTLRNHLTSIYAKLGLASRAELQALLNGKGSKPAQ